MSETLEISTEQQAVDMRRYQEAFDAGLSHEEASAFSFGGSDIGVLRWLVRNKCDPRLIALIVV